MNIEDAEEIIRSVQRSKKYRNLFLPETMLRHLLATETLPDRSKSEVEQVFRRKLHNIVAPYLENVDYPQESILLESHEDNQEAIRAWALSVMEKHASTHERLPFLALFYQKIFEHIGRVNTILDLACGLNPLAIPWMNLPDATQYFAFDIHKPRIDLLNQFFRTIHTNAKAFQQDILIATPSEFADAAFFFKEAHRFEKRQPGSNRYFFEKLQVKTIVVSLPAFDLAGHHSLIDVHTAMITKAIAGYSWQVLSLLVGNELVFFIEK